MILSRIVGLIVTPIKCFYERQEKSSQHNRFDYLDGYRGTLVLIVIVAHSHQFVDVKILEYDIGITHSYSIAGFFMLSAFLLTSRLLDDFWKSKDPKEITLFTLKYFIRRFFRIYLYYLFYCFLVRLSPKWIGGPVRFDVDLSRIALLDNPGDNHLWTVPPEIKYYLFIPIFSLTVRALNRPLFSLLLLILCMIWTAYDQLYNFFGVTVQDIIYGTATCHLLRGHFFVFFIGSQTALAHFIIKKNDDAMRIIKLKPVQIAINYLSIAIGLIGLKYHEMLYFDSFRFRSRATLFWSCVLLLTLLNETGTIADLYRRFSFLRNLGKYSYSVYLFHFGLLNILGHSSLPKWLNWFEFAWLAILIIYCVGKVLFYLVEQPLIDLANYLCKKLDDIFKYESYSRIEYTSVSA